jgi:hypothetical protein
MPWYLILWQELVLRVVARPQLRVSAVSVYVSEGRNL